MKIGIITRHHLYHHGAILQAYALQTTLEQLGHEIEMIDYREISHERANWVVAVQPISLINNVSLKHYVTRSISLIGWGLLNIDRHLKRNKLYGLFLPKYLKYSSKQYYHPEELLASPPIYDAYIAGSDQIWKLNEETGGLESSFFLDFIPKEKIGIAYAASIGGSVLPQEYDMYMKKLLSYFQYISMREASAIPYIQAFTDISVTNVLDPALLLPVSDWDKLLVKSPISDEYMFVYSVAWNKNLFRFAKKVSKITGLKMVCIGPDYTRFGLRDSVCGPDSFISYIKNASLVVTDSFHGTVFSIQYRKLFYTYPPKGAETRITDLLSLLHLNSRLISSVSDSVSMEDTIDYEEVQKLLNNQRAISISFLQTALSSIPEIN